MLSLIILFKNMTVINNVHFSVLNHNQCKQLESTATIKDDIRITIRWHQRFLVKMLEKYLSKHIYEIGSKQHLILILQILVLVLQSLRINKSNHGYPQYPCVFSPLEDRQGSQPSALFWVVLDTSSIPPNKLLKTLSLLPLTWPSSVNQCVRITGSKNV